MSQPSSHDNVIEVRQAYPSGCKDFDNNIQTRFENIYTHVIIINGFSCKIHFDHACPSFIRRKAKTVAHSCSGSCRI
jgi:hypothetical protein